MAQSVPPPKIVTMPGKGTLPLTRPRTWRGTYVVHYCGR